MSIWTAASALTTSCPTWSNGSKCCWPSPGHQPAAVLGVGLSMPGTVDLARGCSLDSPIMSGWDGIALAPYFRDLTAAPVVVDNDANVMALAQRHGDYRDVDDLLLLKLSTGLGAGIIAGGALQRGAVGAAGEFGHNKVVAAAGLPVPVRRHRLPGGDRRRAGRWCARCSSRATPSATSVMSSNWPTAANPRRAG